MAFFPCCSTYFYPRSPCGERRCGPPGHFRPAQISIHALLAESDPGRSGARSAKPCISIHALLAESDSRATGDDFLRRDFYPRSPCGERLLGAGWFQQLPRFLSTLSLRRATPPICRRARCRSISIHALLAESDVTSSKRSAIGSISIHALLAESDRAPRKWSGSKSAFLSTLSLRRATEGNKWNN